MFTLLFLFLISHRVRAWGGSFNEMTRPEWCGEWEERTDHTKLLEHIIFMHGSHRQKLYFLLSFIGPCVPKYHWLEKIHKQWRKSLRIKFSLIHLESHVRKVPEHHQVCEWFNYRTQGSGPRDRTIKKTSTIKFIHEKNLHMCCSSRCPGCILICTPTHPPRVAPSPQNSISAVSTTQLYDVWKSYTTEWSTK